MNQPNTVDIVPAKNNRMNQFSVIYIYRQNVPSENKRYTYTHTHTNWHRKMIENQSNINLCMKSETQMFEHVCRLCVFCIE